MAEATKIEWADHTWSPWRGCEHAKLPNGSAHPGCIHCYAETMSKRNPTVMGQWGPRGARVRSAPKSWEQVRKWNKDAWATQCWHSANTSHDAVPPRMFPSVCDPFEDWTGRIMDHLGHFLHRCCQCGAEWAADFEDGTFDSKASHCKNCHATWEETYLTMADCRRDLFSLIDETNDLTWILLTKRPQNILKMWPRRADFQYMAEAGSMNDYPMNRRENVWLVYSASDQVSLDALTPDLIQCRDLVPVIGVCLGPMTGPVSLRDYLPQLDWVIVEGESGTGSRPCHLEWIRDVIAECKAASVPCFVKQLGAFPLHHGDSADARAIRNMKDSKGGEISEWPEDLRVRQFPNVNTTALN